MVDSPLSHNHLPLTSQLDLAFPGGCSLEKMAFWRDLLLLVCLNIGFRISPLLAALIWALPKPLVLRSDQGRNRDLSPLPCSPPSSASPHCYVDIVVIALCILKGFYIKCLKVKVSHSVMSDSLTEEPGRLQSMGFSRQKYWSGLPFPSPIKCWLI